MYGSFLRSWCDADDAIAHSWVIGQFLTIADPVFLLVAACSRSEHRIFINVAEGRLVQSGVAGPTANYPVALAERPIEQHVTLFVLAQ